MTRRPPQPLPAAAQTRMRAELSSLTAILARGHLDILGECRAIATAKKLYETLYPSAKRGGNPGRAGGGKKPRSSLAGGKPATVAGFVGGARPKRQSSARSTK